jgi:hypothetical protein
MKQFFITLAAVLIGGFLALLAYDRLVVAPREAAAAAKAGAERAAAQASVSPDFTRAREDAREVADAVEASVQRSVATARDAMRTQADEMDRRAMIGSAISRATMFRVAVAEYYQTNGRWPRTSEDAGLPSSEEMRGPGVAGIALGENGAVVVALDDTLAAGSRILDWRCEFEGDASLKALLPRCEKAK